MVDALIHRLNMAVDASDAAIGVETLRALEAALPKAIQAVADRLGDEVVVLRRLDVQLLVRQSGSGAIQPEFERKLQSTLESWILDRSPEASSLVRYASEAHAMAAYIVALSKGEGKEWPFNAFAHWGNDIGRAVDTCRARDRLFLADMLGLIVHELVRARGGPAMDDAPRVAEIIGAAFDSIFPATTAKAVLEVLGLVEMPLDALRFFDLPSAVQARIDEVVSFLSPALTTEQLRVCILAIVFAIWPPARGRAVELTEISPTSNAIASGSAKRPSVPLITQAAGLLFWAWALEQLGVALHSSYPHQRVCSSVRWALGRALQTASLSGRDPLLLLWSGETNDALASYSQVLSQANPEPLHAAALSLAQRLGFLGTSWRVVPLGDEQVTIGHGDIVLDTTRAEDVHSAVSEVVRNLRRRAWDDQFSFTAENALDNATLDAVSEVDAAFAPDAWRGAIRAMASVLRRWLREEFRAELRNLYDWKAVLTGDRIELRRSDANRLLSDRWLREGTVTLAETSYRIQLT